MNIESRKDTSTPTTRNHAKPRNSNHFHDQSYGKQHQREHDLSITKGCLCGDRPQVLITRTGSENCGGRNAINPIWISQTDCIGRTTMMQDIRVLDLSFEMLLLVGYQRTTDCDRSVTKMLIRFWTPDLVILGASILVRHLSLSR